jgi:CDP-glucose 4,6-dehydratase
MESLGVNLTESYRGRRVLVTGHTGFKGSWLTLMLQTLGAKVSGVSLDVPSTPSHWELLKLSIPDYRVDIRNARALQDAVKKIEPEMVFHLAAQSLVRRSYREPLATWETNVMGTANLLEACRHTTSVKAIVVTTTDKCYENNETGQAYKETDKLGGHDPYSASKAAAEMVAASYRNAFFHEKNSPLLATARAGNVIGGGDWSENRLIPDLVCALAKNETLTVRSPNATRPWQHVLDLLTGYLQLGEKLLAGDHTFAEAWNFGPDASGNCSVGEVLTKLRVEWPKIEWQVTKELQPHEAMLLSLDSTKARTKLGWQPKCSLENSLEATALWYKYFYEKNSLISREQLENYL